MTGVAAPLRFEYRMDGPTSGWHGRLYFQTELDRDIVLSSLFRSVRDIPDPKQRKEVLDRVRANYLAEDHSPTLLIRGSSVRNVLKVHQHRDIPCVREVSR